MLTIVFGKDSNGLDAHISAEETLGSVRLQYNATRDINAFMCCHCGTPA